MVAPREETGTCGDKTRKERVGSACLKPGNPPAKAPPVFTALRIRQCLAIAVGIAGVLGQDVSLDFVGTDAGANAGGAWRVGICDTSGYAFGIAVSGNIACVADGLAGLQVVDILDPASPRRVGGFRTSGSAFGVAVSGNYAYLACPITGLEAIDISNPASPRRVGGPAGGDACGLAVSGGYAFVAERLAGLGVIDISDPASLRRVGGCDTAGDALGVAVSGRHAYMSDGDAGLQVIDISDPANPRPVGGCETAGNALGVVVLGNYAYVADGAAGLQIIDISTPSSPSWVGEYQTSGWAAAVGVSGDYAFVGDWEVGLVVVNISEPANPRRVSAYSSFSLVFGVAVSGNNAYVACGESGLVIVSRLHPQTIDFLPPPFARLDGPPLALSATASSGLPVSYRVVSGPGTVDGNTLTLTGEGTVIVRAEQLGDELYEPAWMEQQIMVTAASACWLDIAKGADGQVTITIKARSGAPIVLEGASRLGTSVQWVELLNTIPPVVPCVFNDTTMGPGQRFYRVRIQ